MRLLPFVSLVIIFSGCSGSGDNQIDRLSYELGVVGGFSELVNAGVKQLALSSPMTSAQMDEFYDRAVEVAESHHVEIFREPELVVTDLFPADITKDKEVLLIYQGHTLAAYKDLKRDKARLEEQGNYEGLQRQEIARRFGRLLSYSPRKINQLLAANTDFRTMADHGIRASNVFLYYDDLSRATEFYTEVLGLELLAVYDNASVLRVAESSYLILVDAAKGMHSTDEPKTVALALITDQLSEWYEYLMANNVEIKSAYKRRDRGPHDNFVAVDPEGYLLEFERFTQHPGNERFLPVLNNNKTIFSSNPGFPEGLGFKATITWLYHKNLPAMENFYQNVLGLERVADHGWVKVYQVTDTGFIGLVDEKRGMHPHTEDKAVTVSFILDDIDGWFDYVKSNSTFDLREDAVDTGPEGKYRAFVGYGPEGYFLEFDRFYEHRDNNRIMELLYAE